MTIQELEKNNLLGYKYIRGSHLYGTNLPPVNGVEQSDIDYGGVYVLPNDMLLGLNQLYQTQVSDEKCDTVYYELGKWVELLINSNPNTLESLYIPKDKVIGEIHPAIQLFIDNRDLFLTKKCFNSLIGYSYAQIQKCRGLNKKINQPMLERKSVLDFCYTFKEQGSQSIIDFLNENGLKQQYCGLVNIPNMKDVYGLYYDFAAHVKFEMGNNKPDFKFLFKNKYVEADEIDIIVRRVDENDLFGYAGIVNTNNTSNEVRLSSIPKGEKPICYMTYNQNGYVSHCKKYKEYKEWEKNRNPIRYESNLKSNYDSKNVSHCVRLMHMGKELIDGKGFNIVRTEDRDFLIDIRNHKYEYDYIIKYVEDLFEYVKSKQDLAPLPDTVDINKINDLLIKARNL